MKIFGKELTPTGESVLRLIIFSLLTVAALITAILTSFMITESGTKEHNWWVALMSISWPAFGLLGLAAAYCGYDVYRITHSPAGYISLT